jgi:hypothetical protein
MLLQILFDKAPALLQGDLALPRLIIRPCHTAYKLTW